MLAFCTYNTCCYTVFIFKITACNYCNYRLLLFLLKETCITVYIAVIKIHALFICPRDHNTNRIHNSIPIVAANANLMTCTQ